MIWEYKTLTLPCSAERQEMLSEMGLSGWELVGFEQGLAYFKRRQAEVIGAKPADASRIAAATVETRTIGSKKK